MRQRYFSFDILFEKELFVLSGCYIICFIDVTVGSLCSSASMEVRLKSWFELDSRVTRALKHTFLSRSSILVAKEVGFITPVYSISCCCVCVRVFMNILLLM